MPRLLRLHFGFLLLAGLTAAAVARAEAQTVTDDRPQISARSFGPLAAGQPVSVEARDDSDTNLRLRDRMAARLVAQGRPVLPGAALQLRFSADAVTNAGPVAGASSGDTTAAADHQSYTPSNLGYSEADRFFSGPTERTPQAIDNLYRVRATLERRDTGQTLWQGEATGALTDRNETRLSVALVEALTDMIGRTVDAREPVESRPTAGSTVGTIRLPLPELAERR
jgi:hypothetical protein